MLGNGRPAVRDLAALAEHAGAVGIFELHEMMVKNLPMAFGIAHLPSAHALGANWMRRFNPIADVNVMNVLLDDVVMDSVPSRVAPIAADELELINWRRESVLGDAEGFTVIIL